MKALGTDVFERGGTDEMSRRAFFLVLGAILAWGFYATSAVAEMTSAWEPSIWAILGVGLVLPLIGIFMSVSGNAFVSFVGYHLVVIPLGAVLGPVLAGAELASPGIVSQAASLTAMVAGVMAVLGIAFPNFYRGLGDALFGALLALLAVYVLGMFFPAIQEFSAIHYIAASIFAVYIGYDMHRASEIPATIDNAVDVAVSLYLDVINLFLSILRILDKD